MRDGISIMRLSLLNQIFRDYVVVDHGHRKNNCDNVFVLCFDRLPCQLSRLLMMIVRTIRMLRMKATGRLCRLGQGLRLIPPPVNFIPETEPFHADIGDEQVKRRPLGSSEAHSADTPCADAEVAKCQQLSSMTLTYLGQGKYIEPGSLLPRFLSLPRRLRSPLRFSHIAWHSATH